MPRAHTHRLPRTSNERYRPHPIINSKLAFTPRLVAAVSTLMESLDQHCVEFVPLLQVLHPRLTRPRSPFPTTLDRCESNHCPTFNNETIELPILDEYLFVSPEKLVKQQIRGHFLDRSERHEVFHGRCNHPTRSIRDRLDHLYLPHETIVFEHLLSTATSDFFIQRTNRESTRRLMRHSTNLIFDHRPQRGEQKKPPKWPLNSKMYGPRTKTWYVSKDKIFWRKDNTLLRHIFFG
ncbi:hypothetical protein BGZ57DRAFT_424156 [Hyaloscypha finlandica]|nr:hypothetical protein BGZ57DRAFT_424156 [Hyaloscypha finlandica]